VIDRALRDEGTSYHYAAPSQYSEADPDLIAATAHALKTRGVNIATGSSWTTDAPFRETEEAIAAARSKGILVVEMEAAALYAFARARVNGGMSAIGPKQTLALALHMSALGGKADINFDGSHVILAWRER
jgi:uridine phosphorylase